MKTLEPLPNVQAPDIDRCVQKYIYEKTFSAASVVASVGGKVFHNGTYGTLIEPPPLKKVSPGVLFDLASLTKPLATGLATLWLVSHSRMDLGAPLSTTIPELRQSKFEKITLDMLLDHTAGFPASRNYHEQIAEHDARAPRHEQWMGKPEGVAQIKKMVADTHLESDPGTKAVYSDVGFMVLGWVIEELTGLPLDQFLLREIYRPLGLEKDLFYIRLDDQRARAQLARRQFAATEQCSWRDKLLQGEVHDPVAWAMGGVAGHAGLFGTAEAVWRLCHHLWASFKGRERTFLAGTVRRFWTRSRRVRNTTRALAWDTPTANDSSAGKRYSRNAVGHLGFTGGSIWIDLSSDVIGVILTNSAHPTPDGKDEAMSAFRPRMYDLIAKEGESVPPESGQATGAAAFGHRG